MVLSRSRRRVLAVVLVLAPLPACSVHQMAREAATASADVTEERARRPGPSPVGSTVTHVLEDPRVQQAASEMARQVASQGVAELTESVRHTAVIRDVTPQLETALRSAMTTSVHAAAESMVSDPATLDRMSTAVAQSMGHGLSSALADPDPAGLTPALGGLVRTASREAIVGLNQGMLALDPVADPAMHDRIYKAGLVFGEGMGRGMPTGMAENRGLLALLTGLLAAVSLLGGAALYALWKQNQATSRALLLLSQRLEPSPRARADEPPPSRRPPLPPVASPSLA